MTYQILGIKYKDCGCGNLEIDLVDKIPKYSTFTSEKKIAKKRLTSLLSTKSISILVQLQNRSQILLVGLKT